MQPNQRKSRTQLSSPDPHDEPPATLIPGKRADSILGQSKATRYRRLHTGTHPKPRKIGSRVRYVLGEVLAQAKADAEAGL